MFIFMFHTTNVFIFMFYATNVFIFMFRTINKLIFMGARCSPVVVRPLIVLMGRRIGGPIELFLFPPSAARVVYQRPWYVLFCMWDGACVIFMSLTVNIPTALKAVIVRDSLPKLYITVKWR